VRMKGVHMKTFRNFAGGILVAVALALVFPNTGKTAEAPAVPRLVLEITVDQLRGDLPERYLARMGSGGFRYLLENGAVYKNAHHAHSNTETIVGHVTLSTGAYPSRHGMVGNVWFDAEKDRLVYNIEDPDYAATGGLGARDMDSEVDATQVSKTEGRSPKTIVTTTFSDELSLFYGAIWARPSGIRQITDSLLPVPIITKSFLVGSASGMNKRKQTPIIINTGN